MFLRTFILIILAAMLASCGSKKGTVPVKMKIFSSNLIAAGTADGGVVLIGQSEDKIHSFKVGLLSAESGITLDLPKGRWEFAAISWAGTSGPLTGNNRCAYSGMVDLNLTEASVSLNLTSPLCASLFNGRQFSHNDFMNTATGIFRDFVPVICFDGILNDTNCPAATNLSSLLSYKVVFEPWKRGEIQGALTPLVSNCLPIGTTPRAKIPVTDSGTDTPFGATVVFFPSNDCSGNPVVYNFRDGLKNNYTLPTPVEVSPISTNYSGLYINPGFAFNLTPINPASLNANGANFDGTSSYHYASSTITYLTSAIPAGVDTMCVTSGASAASCAAGDWVPAVTTGSVIVPAGEGVKSMKLYFKSMAGILSSTPATFTATVDTTFPSGTLGTSSGSQTTGVYVTYNGVSDANIKELEIRVFSDAGLTTMVGSYTIPTPGTSGSHQFNNANLSGGFLSGNSAYIKIYVRDFAGNTTTSAVSTITIDP